MTEKSYSTSDLSRKSGDIIAEALRRPVTITQRNKPRLVIMNADDYAEMRRRASPQRAISIEQLGDFVTAEELRAAVEAYEKGADGE